MILLRCRMCLASPGLAIGTQRPILAGVAFAQMSWSLPFPRAPLMCRVGDTASIGITRVCLAVGGFHAHVLFLVISLCTLDAMGDAASLGITRMCFSVA